MAEEQIIYNENYREGILRGMDLLAGPLKATIGPNRRARVSRIELQDPYENLGAQMVREVVSKAADAGGGTSTAAVLAQSIFSGAVKAVAAGADPSAIRRGINIASEIVSAELREHSHPASEELIADVATMAADGDREVGEIVARAIREAGKDGLTTIEESRHATTELHAASGLRFERGYLSPYFVTDPERSIAVLDDAYILLCEEKIGDLNPWLPLLEQTSRLGKPLLIIAEDVEGEALALLAVNKMRGTVQVCAVRAPEFGDRRTAVLEDIASFTGGTVVIAQSASALEQRQLLESCGRAKKITVDSSSTTIIDAGGRPEDVLDYVTQLHAELDQTVSDYDRHKVLERLARLSRKAVVVAVGAINETELKEKSARMENALRAAQSAIEEGIVPGGGVALLHASNVLDSLELTGDEEVGVKLLKKACEAPLREIVGNAGFGSYSIAAQLRLAGDRNFGFNVARGEFQDLMRAGIVDSAKITRSSLENAAFVATQLLASEPIIADLPEEAVPPVPIPASPPPEPAISHAKPPMVPPSPPPVAEGPQGPEPPKPSKGFSGNEPAQYVNFDFLDKRELPLRSLDLHEGLYINVAYKLVIGIGLEPDKRATGTQASIQRPEADEVTLDVVIAMASNLKCTTGAWKIIQWPAFGPSVINAEFDVEAASPGTASAKVLIYYEHGLLFCGDLRITTKIEPDDWPEGETAIYWLQLKEEKAASLTLFKQYRLLDREHRRSLNISVHKGELADEYDLVFFFRRKNELPPKPAVESLIDLPAYYPLTIKLSEAEVTDYLARARLALRAFMDDPAVKESGKRAADYSGAYRSAANGGGNDEALAYVAGQQLLKDMTIIGSELRRKLFAADIGKRLENMLAEELSDDGAIIQVWIDNDASSFVLPWVWINPMQVEEGKKFTPDPHIFWGYKYIIEQIRHARQPSVEDHTDMSVRPLQLAGGIHDFVTGPAHLKFFLDCRDLYKPAFQWEAVQDNEWANFLTKCASHIVYLYCHGHTEQLLDSQFIEISNLIKKIVENSGTSDRAAAEYVWLQQRKRIRSRSSLEIRKRFLTMADLEKFHPVLPAEAPLVFLNMCEATEFYPGMNDNFVDVFLERGARGVIGTEMPMLVEFGALFARRFFEVFFSPAVLRQKKETDGCAIGQVLWQLRREFIDKGNPMAFGYTYFGDATMRLKPPLATGERK